NQRIRADRRLYMTATPRIFAAPDLAESADTTRPRRRTPNLPGTAADLFANSMDNEQVYGKKIWDYPLAQAIEDGRAPDYRIVVPTLTDDDLRRRINLPAPDPDGEGEGPDQALRTTALHLAVLRAMADHGLKKVLVYFNLTSDARLFALELPHTLRQLAATAPHLVPAARLETLFVHGEDTPQRREETFTRFARASTAILTNARLVAEGVDIPSVDAVVFADPTRSVIRCVQALGRALRLDVSGKTASLIVPVCLPPDASPEDILGSAYEPVWAIASALASHDHRILERLPDKANRLPKETSDVIERRWHFDFTVRPERIAQAMDLVSFDPRDPATSRSRRLGLAAAQAYHDQYGHLDVPADYTDPTGHTLGTFITTMRDARKAGRLEADWIAELDALDMIWDKHEATWRSHLTAAADRTTTPRHHRPARPRPGRRPHRHRPRLAPALRRGLAPQVPPPAHPPGGGQRSRRPHARHPYRRGQHHFLAHPPAHPVDHPPPRPARPAHRTRPHPHHQHPGPSPPYPPHLRPDRAAPGTLPPPPRPRPHRPRNPPRRRRHRPDRPLVRQDPHQAPRRPAPRRPRSPDRRPLRRRLVRPQPRPGRPGVTRPTPKPFRPPRSGSGGTHQAVGGATAVNTTADVGLADRNVSTADVTLRDRRQRACRL
ncbi:helicase associated domain-containing protein, partial [Streptomyces cyaneofuscatus]|uniref:helicase associated domain-containing protein n=1 Tax=Streptomyces cyaneofuscatus TaxID=66883 RepID=UPI0033BAB48A